MNHPEVVTRLPNKYPVIPSRCPVDAIDNYFEQAYSPRKDLNQFGIIVAIWNNRTKKLLGVVDAPADVQGAPPNVYHRQVRRTRAYRGHRSHRREERQDLGRAREHLRHGGREGARETAQGLHAYAAQLTYGRLRLDEGNSPINPAPGRARRRETGISGCIGARAAPARGALHDVLSYRKARAR